MAALGAFLAIDPARPLFLWLGGLHLFLALRALAFSAVLVVGTRSALRFKWLPRTVPVPEAGADPLLTLRGFACLMVLVGHGTLVVFLPSNFDDLVRAPSLYRLVTPSPWVGVWVFFVLSGYLMGKGFYGGRYAIDRAGILRFYRNRLLRIAPIYWSAVLIVALIQARDVFEPANLPGLVSSLLFFQSISLPGVVIGALWSVQTEMGFYLAAPVLFVALCYLAERFEPRKIFLALAAAGLLYRVVITQFDGAWAVSVYSPTLSNLDLFCGGMLSNWFLQNRGAWQWDRRLVVVGCAVLFFGGAFVHSAAMADHLRRNLINFGPLVTLLTTSAIIVWLERTKLHGRLVMATQWFGILTYAVYVVHEPIFLALKRMLPHDLSAAQTIAFTAAAIAVSIIVATCAYLLIERPFDEVKRMRPRAV